MAESGTNYELKAITRSRAANSRKEVETKATLGLQPQLQNVLRYLTKLALTGLRPSSARSGSEGDIIAIMYRS